MARANQVGHDCRHPAQDSRASATLAIRWAAYARRAGPVVIGLAAVVMMCWSWGTWPDVIIDFGRELYVPWRLAEGEVLYRDVAYFNGPLSPYFNSVWFRLFGASLRTLALVNFALVGVLLVLLYALILRIGSRVSAFMACLTFVFVFGFSRYMMGGNFNYICPYSHEITHGLLLSLAALVCVSRYVHGGRLADAALCGLCVGLVFLTKPEIFLAVLPAAGLGIALADWSLKRSAARMLPASGAFVGSLLVPPLLAVALLSLALPLADAVRGTLGGFRWLFTTEITSLPFYRLTMGTLDSFSHRRVTQELAFWYVALVGIPVGVGFLRWRTRGEKLGAAVACFVTIAGFLSWNFAEIPATQVLQPVPAVLLVALVVAIGSFVLARGTADRSTLVLPIACILFALLLLAKIALWVHIAHYGFGLAMPAAMMLIVVAWDWLPRAVERIRCSSEMLRATFLGVWLLVVARCLVLMANNFATLTVPMGSGSNAFWGEPRGESVNRLVEQIHRHASPAATLAVAPEGCMLNFLTGHVNSTPYIVLMPVEMLMFGEDRIVASYEANPPDFLVLAQRDMGEYGFREFGDGYAEKLLPWFKSHYQLAEEPVVDSPRLPPTLMQRKNLPENAADNE